MLMAAGLGTRLRPFTEMEPKALLPLMGVPMAQFALDALAAGGVTHVVANLHHHAEKARDGFSRLAKGPEMTLDLSDESGELLGSAGGIRKALPLFGGEPFFLVNADVLCEVDLGALARAHALNRARNGAVLTLTVFRAGPAGGKYREILFDAAQGLVTGFGVPAEGKPYFVGAAVIEPEALASVPEGPQEFVPTILEPAIRAGKAGLYVAEGQWHDIGSPQLWLNAHTSLIQGLECGRVPPLWRARVESGAKRVAPNIWISRACSKNFSLSEWAGPVYWDSMCDETARPPQKLGPRAVMYGAAHSPGETFSGGIGYRGVWVR